MSDRVRLSFRKWDTEGKGMILKDELAYVLRFLDPQTTDGELDALFSAAQMTGDDKISYERFVSWLFCDIPEAYFKFSIADWSEFQAAKGKSLWEVCLSLAVRDAAEHYPKAKVESYFSDVEARINGSACTEQVRKTFLDKFGNDARVSFDEAAQLVDSMLQCTPEIAPVAKPSPSDIRAAFDAHDSQGQGRLGLDDILNVVRFLQVRVALATLIEAESRAAQELRRYQVDKKVREKGLWQGAMAVARAKASQRFGAAAVEAYFNEVNAKLSGDEYAAHVKGEFFRKTDTNKDGKVSFGEALGLINNTLECASDMGGAARPTPQAIREAFDAHDTIEEGWNFMGGNEFLNLMRYLQVQVAEVMLPLSTCVTEHQDSAVSSRHCAENSMVMLPMSSCVNDHQDSAVA